MPTAPKTYTFTTFQELLDVVPADRITLCLHEIGAAFAQAKLSVEVVYESVRVLASKDGKILPELTGRVVEIPNGGKVEWIDDDEGVIDVGITKPDGEVLFRLTNQPPESADGQE